MAKLGWFDTSICDARYIPSLESKGPMVANTTLNDGKQFVLQSRVFGPAEENLLFRHRNQEYKQLT